MKNQVFQNKQIYLLLVGKGVMSGFKTETFNLQVLQTLAAHLWHSC